MSKKSSKYCQHMNEEDFDMEDEEEVQSSEDVEMKRVDIVAFVPGARDDAGVNAPMCVAEGDGVPLPEIGVNPLTCHFITSNNSIRSCSYMVM